MQQQMCLAQKLASPLMKALLNAATDVLSTKTRFSLNESAFKCSNRCVKHKNSLPP
jgi:uncharacterized protein (DUF1778 family)